jgi:hypothetical protein
MIELVNPSNPDRDDNLPVLQPLKTTKSAFRWIVRKSIARSPLGPPLSSSFDKAIIEYNGRDSSKLT